MSFQEKSLQCSDCGRTFAFTVEEQEFFASKGFTNEPEALPFLPSGKESRAVRWKRRVWLQ